MPYRGYKARRSLARVAPGPRRADIMRAIPRGSRRVCGRSIERRYLDALVVLPAFLALRADARASVLDFAKWLARCAEYGTGTTRPTRARLCQLAGRSESTWKAARRRLESWGYLGTVTPGCKYWRGETPGGDPAETRCDAAVYVLCLPRSATAAPAAAAALPATRPPTGDRRLPSTGPRARGSDSGAALARGTHPRGRHGRAHASRGPACGAASSAAAAAALRTGPGETITDGWMTHLAAPFLDAGWTPADLAHAVDYRPAGDQHRSPLREIAKPAQWLRWRLSLWLVYEDQAAALPRWDEERGRQIPARLAWRKARPARSRSQQLGDARARLLEQQRADQSAAAAAAAAAVPPPVGWARRALGDAGLIPAPATRSRSSRTE